MTLKVPMCVRPGTIAVLRLITPTIQASPAAGPDVFSDRRRTAALLSGQPLANDHGHGRVRTTLDALKGCSVPPKVPAPLRVATLSPHAIFASALLKLRTTSGMPS